MRAGNFFFIAVLSVGINACGSNNEQKKEAGPSSKDSIVTEEKLPSIEKEFADTLNAKPVKDSVLLRFHLQKGKNYNYEMSFDVTQKKEEQSRTTAMKWNYDMQVEDGKDDLATIKTTYKKIEMTMNMGNGQKMEFSSEKQADAGDFMQLPSKMFGIIKGKSFIMQVNGKGEVVSVSGLDKIGEAVLSEMNLPDEMKPMMQQNFKKQFNEDAVKQMFSQSFDIFPNRYVKVGDSWKRNTSLAALKQEVATVYTVTNIRGSRVFLTGTSKLNSNDEKKSGTQTARLIINARTGLVTDGVFDFKSNDGQMISKSRITGKEL
jgi:hypothetical protein